ncbi:probable rRNA-processing protein EBP2 [Anneissia japonica]|uniref:probable rRNA-processing protein EBP2 n=1 Tax=Anneissia japonica TaxID=1529436 RepID=UPI0014257002|nr:probable rRNA-processing protein EBP2 [Anneissia japonica]
MSSDSDSNEYLDSDEELQEAFKGGSLKPGLNFATNAPKKSCNDEAGLQSKLTDFSKELEWYERLDITTDIDQHDETNYDDDFQRELKFYHQAQAAVLKALPRLQNLGIPTKRPSDYFAEMVKTDDHMQKIKQKIISKKSSLEKSEKAKKLRDLKKYGKKVQHEVLQKRQKEKKEMIEAVKKYRKGQNDKLDFLGIEGDSKTKSGFSKAKGPGQKRQFKNDKFGFGGRKKGQKQNTQDSFRQVDNNLKPRKFNSGAMKKGKKGGKKTRPGKKKRQQAKGKRK